jgi:ABC-type multidrug transport system fused ATPase/permease subunit
MKNYFRLLKYIRNYKGYAWLHVLSNLFSVIFSLVSLTMIIPFLNILFSQQQAKYELLSWSFSDKVIRNNIYYYVTRLIETEGKMHALILICIAVVVLFFVKNLFRYLAMYFMAPIRNGVVRDIRNQLYNKILSLPLSYFTERRKGDIISRATTDVSELEVSVMNSLEFAFREPLTVIMYLFWMFVLSPQLSAFVLVLLPISGWFIGTLSKSLRKTSAIAREKMGRLLSTIEETISGLRIIKAFTAEKYLSKKFSEQNFDYYRLQKRIYRRYDLSAPLSEFLGAVVLSVVMYFGGKLVLSPQTALQPEVFILFIALFSQLIPPAKAFTTAYYSIQKGLGSAERIHEVLDAENVIREAASPVVIASFKNKIEYKNVSFAYRQGETGYVLRNINLNIEKGKTVALVGQSGSGKTTLADMLPRYYDPSEGEILIDGINIRELKLHDLRKLFGVVSQESILFNDTVFNNIAFGLENVKKEDVIHAAQSANAHEFIIEMPEGYHTNIGDRGSKLSGGQRQRISIARAILKNPSILILDEATSALDSESERLVQESLLRLIENRTSIVIAHRLSTIMHADEIIVLQKGEIIERGTHASLIGNGSAYKKLYDLQSFI